MQVAKSSSLVTTGKRYGIYAVIRLAFEIAPQQAYALSFAKVDGRNNVHAGRAAKLLRSFEPALAERSG